MTKKKIIIASSLVVLALALVIIIIIINRNNLGINQPGITEEPFIPEFLSVEEKQSLGIPAEERIQVINRDNNNEVSVYRVVGADEEVVDPRKITPISPRTSTQE